jgi:rhodanese-related sulfurtransferase
MTAQLIPLKPTDVAARLRDNTAILVDIREPDEFASGHVEGAVSQPLSRFGQSAIAVGPGQEVIFTCRSGMRTNANCGRLAERVEGDAFVLEGGLNAWMSAGLPVARR